MANMQSHNDNENAFVGTQPDLETFTGTNIASPDVRYGFLKDTFSERLARI
jgi:hypothetical protein